MVRDGGLGWSRSGRDPARGDRIVLARVEVEAAGGCKVENADRKARRVVATRRCRWVAADRRRGRALDRKGGAASKVQMAQVVDQSMAR